MKTINRIPPDTLFTLTLDDGRRLQFYRNEKVRVMHRHKYAGWEKAKKKADEIESGMYVIDGDRLCRIERVE